MVKHADSYSVGIFIVAIADGKVQFFVGIFRSCCEFVKTRQIEGSFPTYIQALSVYGTQLSENYVKHLDGDIWELRPIRNRILFVGWHNGSFVLLHHFMKKSQKTPRKEIDKAKRELNDLIERGVTYEKQCDRS